MLSINENVYAVKCKVLHNANCSTFIVKDMPEALKKSLLNYSLSSAFQDVVYTDESTEYNSKKTEISYFGSNKFYVRSIE